MCTVLPRGNNTLVCICQATWQHRVPQCNEALVGFKIMFTGYSQKPHISGMTWLNIGLLMFQSPVVTLFIKKKKLKVKKFHSLPTQWIHMFSLELRKTAIIRACNMNRIFCITDKKNVFCAVRAECWNKNIRLNFFIIFNIIGHDQPRGLVVRVSDY